MIDVIPHLQSAKCHIEMFSHPLHMVAIIYAFFGGKTSHPYIYQKFSMIDVPPQKIPPPQCCRMCPTVNPQSPCVDFVDDVDVDVDDAVDFVDDVDVDFVDEDDVDLDISIY